MSVGVHFLRVRYAETDQMGVAHHGSYIPWIEEARTEWMRERGMSYRELEERGFALAVTNVSVRYRQSAKYDDRIRIETRITVRNMASVTLGYELYRTDEGAEERGPLLAQAETRLALLGPEGRPTRIPEGLFDFDADGPNI